jgi:hypothetical protein
MAGQLTKLVKEYGRLAVGVHTVNSATILGAAVVSVHYGLDVASLLTQIGCGEMASASGLVVEGGCADGGKASLASEAAVGFVIYKAAAPVRWPLTVGMTTAIAKYTNLR